jgi:hypothetical protein
VLCELILGKYPYENEPESTATFEQAIVSVRFRAQFPLWRALSLSR